MRFISGSRFDLPIAQAAAAWAWLNRCPILDERRATAETVIVNNAHHVAF
ncbi:MAG: hypothetical protein ACTHJP_02390 [Rhodanobacteraceae bacterium]